MPNLTNATRAAHRRRFIDLMQGGASPLAAYDGATEAQAAENRAARAQQRAAWGRGGPLPRVRRHRRRGRADRTGRSGREAGTGPPPDRIPLQTLPQAASRQGRRPASARRRPHPAKRLTPHDAGADDSRKGPGNPGR